jgi:hypothetical protein
MKRRKRRVGVGKVCVGEYSGERDTMHFKYLYEVIQPIESM